MVTTSVSTFNMYGHTDRVREKVNARTSDPRTSHEAVAKIKQNTSLKMAVLEAGTQLGEFTDDELTERVEQTTLRRQQRNVIARTRKTLTNEGCFVLTPTTRVNAMGSTVQVHRAV